MLNAGDFERWEPLNAAYLAELRIPLEFSHDQRQEEFESAARADRVWGAFDGDRLVAIAGLNAEYARLGQVGGVYSRPEERRKGYAPCRHASTDGGLSNRHRFERLCMFTVDDNSPPRRLYESLGFQPVGTFGLFLGTRPGDTRAEQRCKWTGQSGEVYTYEIHEWPTRLSPGPGNYIFAASEAAGGWRPMLIGECADLSDLRAWRARGVRHDVTHVHVRMNFNPVAVRRREAADLAERSGGQRLQRVANDHPGFARMLGGPEREPWHTCFIPGASGFSSGLCGEARLIGFLAGQSDVACSRDLPTRRRAKELDLGDRGFGGIVAHSATILASASVHGSVGAGAASARHSREESCSGGLTTRAGRHGETVAMTTTPSEPILRNTSASISARTPARVSSS